MSTVYTVLSTDGVLLKELKTLPAAKKLADAEGGIVMQDGKQVYPVAATEPASEALPEPVPYEVLTDVYVRSAPEIGAKAVGRVWPGDTLAVLAEEGDWLRVDWHGEAAFVRHFGHQYARKQRI